VNYLLDTNHWSYLQRKHPVVLAHIQSLPNEATLYMPVVAQAELLVGVELAASEPRKQALRVLYGQVTAEATDILGITSEVAERFADVFAALRRQGKPIGTNDVWIAAIALTHDLILVSGDEHFQYVDGLRLEDWTKPMGTEEGKQP